MPNKAHAQQHAIASAAAVAAEVCAERSMYTSDWLVMYRLAEIEHSQAIG